MSVAKPGHAPDLEKYLKSLKGQPLEASIESLVSLLKRRQIQGSEPCAIATAHILLQVVAKSKWTDVDQLLEQVQGAGRRIVAAQPKELVVANIVRRVLGLIRDEAAEDRNEGSSETTSEAQMTPTPVVPDLPKINHQWPTSTFNRQDSRHDSIGDYMSAGTKPPRPPALTSFSSYYVPKTLFSLLEASPPADASGILSGSPFGRGSGASTPLHGQSSRVHALRSEVIEAIEEIKDEISQVDDQIAAFAEVQIHPRDYVLVHKPSHTVQKFILRAAARRKFAVFIVTEPTRGSSSEVPFASFRKKLASAGITVVNIMNGGLMAYMPRINKVILSAGVVLANGGITAEPGAAVIARAAKEQGNQVIVLSGVYKLSPESSFDEESLTEWGSAAGSVSFADGAMVNGVEVRSAVTEHVPAELIDTYITNLGVHSRNHLSSIIADHYKQEDVECHLWPESEI